MKMIESWFYRHAVIIKIIKNPQILKLFKYGCGITFLTNGGQYTTKKQYDINKIFNIFLSEILLTIFEILVIFIYPIIKNLFYI